MKQMDAISMAPDFIRQMSRNGGAFLTVKDKDGRVNTMTIGWGQIGHAWNVDILTVMVREARYTYELIENAEAFTVSVPLEQDMKQALALCGTKSGRDMDKFRAADLTAQPGQSVDCPVVAQCRLHFECRIAMRHMMHDGCIAHPYSDRAYAKKDYHKLYTGEITACYITD